MPFRQHLHVLLSVLLVFATAFGKDQPAQIITWPESGAPVLRFSFAKFKEIGGVGSERTYVTETTAENLWGKAISNASFSLYLFDKNKVRIGEGMINLSSVGVGESVKFQTTIASSGSPVSVSLVAKYLPPELGPARPPRMVSITVNSVPQGAGLKVDGNETGITPKIVQLATGKHLLEFSKEGFNPGRFPMEISSDDASGGSVSYELGASAHDSIELRDRTVVSGDLQSISATEVMIRAGGKDISYERNQVRRVLLVQRGEPQPAVPAVPAPVHP